MVNVELKDIHLKHQKNISINIPNVDFNCRVLGNGAINVIAFHGFGQDGNAFAPVAMQNPIFTIYSFDLPFHGETIIQNPFFCLTSQELRELIQKLITQVKLERFSLMGYSIGSKLIFPILEEFLSRIDHVWLLAPDGITLNFWYRAATRTHLMRFLFQKTVHNYQLLKGLGNLILSLNFMDKSTILFAMKSMNTQEKREQIYHIWTYLRKLKLFHASISSKLNEMNVPVCFILGDRDSIITLSKAEPLIKKLHNSTVVTLSCGHQRLIEHFSEWNSKNFN